MTSIDPVQDYIIFGSASVLAVFPEEGMARGAIEKSYDADFVCEPFDETLILATSQAIGIRTAFDKKFGYHADFVRPIVFEQFPPGWRDRLVPLPEVDRVFCLEPHDMAAAKCLAGREKDIEQLSNLAVRDKIDLDLLYKQAALLHGTHRALHRPVESEPEQSSCTGRGTSL